MGNICQGLCCLHQFKNHVFTVILIDDAFFRPVNLFDQFLDIQMPVVDCKMQTVGKQTICESDHAQGNMKRSLIAFVGLHTDTGPARHLRITSLSSKGNKTSFNIPLGVIRFAYSLFPNSMHFTINNRQLDVEELMERIYTAEKGVVYEDDSENVVFELV
mgnify:CR=1 FL=1